MLIIFTSDGKKRDILYLVAACPRPRCPDGIVALRAKGPAAFLACPMLALPACVPLAFLEAEAPRGLLRQAAGELSGGFTVGGFTVGGITVRGRSAFADIVPAEAWLRARVPFAGLSLESPFTERPGVCLGPPPAGARPSLSGPLRLRRLSVDLFRIGFPEDGWEAGLEWSVIASAPAPKDGR